MIDAGIHGVGLRKHHVRNQLVGHYQMVCHTVGIRIEHTVGILQSGSRVFIYGVVECLFKFIQRIFREVFAFAASVKGCGNDC